jgi:hypothetical protein
VDTGIPVIPVRFEDVLPCRSLQYFIGPQHWLDALTPPLEQHLHRLTDTIKALLSKRLEGFDAASKEPRLKPPTDAAGETPTPPGAQPPPAATRAEPTGPIPPSPPARKFAWRVPLILAILLVAAALGGGAVWWIFYQPAAPSSVRASAKPSAPAMTAEEKSNNEEHKISQTISGKHKIYLRIYNIDDIGKAYLNGTLVKEVNYGGDTGWLDITNQLRKGRNIFRFTLYNKIGGWTYGFMIRKDENILWKMECGKAGYIGCNYNDQIIGLVFDKVVQIDNLLE